MQVIVEARDQVKMTDESAVQPVTDLCLKVIICPCKPIIITAEMLSAALCQALRCVIHRKKISICTLHIVHGPDQIFHLFQKSGLLLIPRLKEHIQFRAAQNIQPAAEGLLQAADLLIILLQFHPDFRIHMPGKAQMGKTNLHGPFRHLLRRISAVAEYRVCMKISSEHMIISPARVKLQHKKRHRFYTEFS